MNAQSITLFILSSFGITSILVYGKIFEPIRSRIRINFFKELISCSLCTGFWVSLLLSFFFIGVEPIINFLFATIGSGSSWFLCSLTQLILWAKAYVEIKTIQLHDEK